MDRKFEGVTIAELEAAIAAIKEEQARAEEEAKRQATAEIDEARMVMVDAAVKYLKAIGLVTEEDLKDIDWNEIIEDIKTIEEKLPDLKKAMQFYETMSHFNPMPIPKVKIRVNGGEPTDEDIDIIKRFLADM